MRLSDVIGFLGETTLAQVSLVLAFLAFVVVSAWAISRPRHQIDDWADIPLREKGDLER